MGDRETLNGVREAVEPRCSRRRRKHGQTRDAELNVLRAKPALNAVDAARALKLLE